MRKPAIYAKKTQINCVLSDWFLSDLVANHGDRFSHDAAHFRVVKNFRMFKLW